MKKDKNNKRRHDNWNNGKNNADYRFHYVNRENLELQKKKEKAILEFKSKPVVCPECGGIITDIASAIADKISGQPVHFECIMKILNNSEKTGQNEKIAYIGQGRFALLYFENPRDQRHFSIKKIIEWESKDNKPKWRGEISSLYSQIE